MELELKTNMINPVPLDFIGGMVILSTIKEIDNEA